MWGKAVEVGGITSKREREGGEGEEESEAEGKRSVYRCSEVNLLRMDEATSGQLCSFHSGDKVEKLEAGSHVSRRSG